MLDYDPATKLYLVKRVYVPDHVLERNTAAAASQGGEGAGGEEGGEKGGEGGAERASDREEKAQKSEETAKAVSPETKEVCVEYKWSSASLEKTLCMKQTTVCIFL